MGAADLCVGISVSEPADDELIQLGLSQLHVRHAFIEVVRHVLAAGWSVAYGGDLRARGFTEALLDLVRTYERSVLSGPDHVVCYLAWPIWETLVDGDRAELANLATTVQVAAPTGAPASLAAIGARTAEERWWNAQALTMMRERMIADLGASVVLGGRVAGQQGLYPGVFEEAVIALKRGVPVYVAGGFGGCGRLVGSALRGQMPEELSIDYQSAHTAGYAELLDAAGQAGVQPDFAQSIAELSAHGFDGLNNGLEPADNLRLLATIDVDEVIALVMRGLFTLAGDTPP